MAGDDGDDNVGHTGQQTDQRVDAVDQKVRLLAGDAVPFSRSGDLLQAFLLVVECLDDISSRPLYNTSATEKIKRVTQKEFPAKMVVATQTRRRETPMSHYQHLTISERESIWENKLAGKSLREIARQTGRSVSTISRELKRNGTS